MPAVHPGRPRRGHALQDHRVAAGRVRWRLGQPQRGQCPVDPVQACPLVGADDRIGAELLDERAGQVAKARAAVGEQGLAQRVGDVHAAVGGGQVAPAGERPQELLDRGIHAGPPEDVSRQRVAADPAYRTQVGDAAQQVGQRDHVGAGRGGHHTRPRGGEGRLVGADQPVPSRGRPRPKAGRGGRAGAQHQADRVVGRDLVVPRGRNIQAPAGVQQRLGEPADLRQRLPARVARANHTV
jgi:hypothetical protein